MCAVAVAVGDVLSPMNMFGVVLCILGNVAYFLKRTKEREETAEAQPVLGRDFTEED